MEVPSLDFLKRDFDAKDQFCNDYREWEKIHSTFPKTLDRTEHDINLKNVSDEKLLSVIRNSIKEYYQIYKPSNHIRSKVERESISIKTMELCERVSSPKFIHPSNSGIYGNTGTGKTHFLKRLFSRPNEYFVTEDGKK